ncbi:TonB-dependent receptor [Neolewinella aurantiaca]|uniref:TonB-dependent receptor n=1 Tax=Neolewinella aurantiaca TaxID=2602767 RepID=A0A5C7FTD9_9BACT|nr:outer membrane beta-barrel family protein [Neolewinella aurantiaca]TXF89500.1 TonB-dependent receptor [Neolewinella aurantiaca]
MFKSCLTLQLLLCCLFLSAQSTLKLRGTVLDHDTNEPVEFATVSLLNAVDSSLITGAVAGAGGAWEINAPRKASFILQASFIGYDAVFTDVFTVERSSEELTLYLRSGAQILKEVEVTGKKLTDIHRLDRQEFDADQFTNATGGTGTDVIANLPSVAINSQGEITVRGATGFLVLIDGQPVQSDPATILSQLPANAIASVEIITTPGAKYDPDGKAGIVNIITKQGSTDGWSLAGNVNYGLPSLEDYDNKDPQKRYAADLSAGYRAGKWDIAAGLDYRRDDNSGRREGYVNTLRRRNPAGDQLTEFPSDGERSHDRENYSGRLTVNYTPDKKQNLRAGLLAGKKTVWRTADILYLDQTRSFLSAVSSTRFSPEGYYQAYLDRGNQPRREEVLDQRTFYNENLRVRKGDFFIASLDYERDLGNDRKLAISGLYERTILGGPTDNTILPERGSTDSLQYQFNTNDNPLDGYRFNLDYTGKLGAATWESGYQFRYLKHPGDFLYLDRDFGNNRFVENPEFTNGILLRRDVHAAYSQISGATEKLEYAAGLRLEYFDRTVKLNQPDTTYRLDRIGFYPSVNLRYRLGDGLNLKAGYSRRIDRTTTFKMTPFPEREHNETLEQGDAELLPELTDLVELGVASNFGDNSAFATIYYRHTRDVINRVNTIYNDTILNRIYTNVGSADALGLELGLTVFPVGNDWRVSLGGNVYHYQIQGEVFGDEVDTGNWVYSINTTTDVPIFGLADLQLGVNYLSERVTAQGRDGRFFNPYLSLRREFPEQRVTLTFQWQNISLGLWDNNQQRITTSTPNFFTTTNYVYEPDILRLGVGYHFTKLANKAKLPKSEFGDKEF